MKTIAIHLRLETASHRKRLMGVFRQLAAESRYDIRIIPNEDVLCDLLASSNASERPNGIISGIPHSERTRNAITASGIPFVGIGVDPEEIRVKPGQSGFVLNDNEGIGRAAAEFFLRLGNFRSYAYVPDARGRGWSVLRGRAFSAALSKAGKGCSAFQSGDGDTKDLYEFLAGLPRPTAILAAWDGRATDVIHAAHTVGLKIPEDISILGVDDDALICEHTLPPLSSIRTDAEGMGESAARILLAILRGERRRGANVIFHPILGIAERRTTGSPAPATSIIERARTLIDAEATNGIRPEDIAKRLGVSRRLLDLRFQQFEEKSVAERITDRKLTEARRLLSETDIPIHQVFRQAGFGDISYTTKLFKKTTGLSPDAWRAQEASASIRFDAAVKDTRAFSFECLTDVSDTDGAALAGLILQLDDNAIFDLQALRTSIRNGVTSVHVLRRHSRIVASATTVRYATPTGRHSRIEDVVVDEHLRGKGLGRRIMTEVLAALRKEGAQTIELTSRPARVAANALYRSLGFKRHHTNVYKLAYGTPHTPRNP